MVVAPNSGEQQFGTKGKFHKRPERKRKRENVAKTDGTHPAKARRKSEEVRARCCVEQK